jgi:hypothetical protein
MRNVAIAAVALLLAGTVMFAQREGQVQAPPPLPLGEIQKLLDGYAVVQAQEYLGMTDAQFGPFLPKLQALQAARRRGEQERMRLLMELRRLTNARAQAPDTEIQNRVRALRDLEVRSMTDIHGAYEAIDQLLNVRQQARFRLFEQEIEQRKVQLLMRTRQQQNRANRPLANPPSQSR